MGYIVSTIPASLLLTLTAWRLLAGVPTSVPIADNIWCSKSGYTGNVDPGKPFFLGTATPDTVYAGVGPVKYELGPGHVGRGVDRPTYGQRIRVERYGTDGVLNLQEHGEVVIVPWDYLPDCRPTPWSRSARFVPTGKRGFFQATLRDSAQWVDGFPTLDTHMPRLTPFPSHRDFYLRGAESALTPDQLFEVYELLPTTDSVQRHDWGAAHEFVTWYRGNESLQNSYPLDRIARMLAYSAERARVNGIEVTIKGTYRVVVTLPNSAADTFFIRTASRPATAWYIRDPPGPNGYEQPEWDRRALGYQILFWHAESVEALPFDRASATDEKRGVWPISAGEEIESDGGVEWWRGHLEIAQLPNSLPGNRELAELVSVWRSAFSERWRAHEIQSDEVLFRKESDGTLTFRADYMVDGARVIKVFAERVSTVAIPGIRG